MSAPLPPTVGPPPANPVPGFSLFDPVLCECCLHWATNETADTMADGRVLCVYCQTCVVCGSHDCEYIEGPCPNGPELAAT